LLEQYVTTYRFDILSLHVHVLVIFILLLGYLLEGFIDETIQANQIMGDLCDANGMLLSPNGDDSNLVTKAQQNAGDLSRHAYTQLDKMVLHKFEGALAPAKYLCLFLQDKRNT
jgi:hypothetical protein